MLSIFEDLKLQKCRLNRILLHDLVLSDALDGIKFISVRQFTTVYLSERALAEDVCDEKVIQIYLSVFTFSWKDQLSMLLLVKLRKRLLFFQIAELFSI